MMGMPNYSNHNYYNSDQAHYNYGREYHIYEFAHHKYEGANPMRVCHAHIDDARAYHNYPQAHHNNVHPMCEHARKITIMFTPCVSKPTRIIICVQQAN